MHFPSGLLLFLAAAAPAAKAPTAAAPDAGQAPALPRPMASALAPLPASERVDWSHSPFEAADCSLCHKGRDPKKPGPLVKDTNELCLDCHEDFAEILKRKTPHPPAQDACTHCHNPHNSRQKHLLRADVTTLCGECHADLVKAARAAKVGHSPVTTGPACASCHDPHGSSLPKLLDRPAFELCLGCHTRELTDSSGKKLPSFKRLLDDNPKWHGPVAAKNCLACHQPHGSDDLRLLAADYPAKFYAPFDAKAYELCFKCHDSALAQAAQTTTATRFRDGSRNLHFVHVNRPDLGRTCRACHDAHAAQQDHLLRGSVPYGTSGWVLKLNYAPGPNGGSCEKTCHNTRSYDRQKK